MTDRPGDRVQSQTYGQGVVKQVSRNILHPAASTLTVDFNGTLVFLKPAEIEPAASGAP